ncbi:protein-glutamate O-methyltransferase CheR [Candidatus Aerophobetes bacterium]|nr:protein-glutamate O-methyltransferase CheR [Candidatus Aerophobetes bacterium]
MEIIGLSQDDFKLFQSFINRKTGIFFDQRKKYFLESRISSRMEECGLLDPREYWRLINTDPEEFSIFVSSITIPETYFFRDYPQLKMFAEEILPFVCKTKKQKYSRALRIWSAGCSTGEEPYTIAIILLEMMEDLISWSVDILGTDISKRSLKRCQEAVYSPRSVKDVPYEYKRKYFISTNTHYQVKPLVKKLVRFDYLNLVDDNRMRTMRGFDFIFCRNVLIYFDFESSKKVISYFYDALNKGGFIFLGSSESISRLSAAFKLVRFKNGLAYMKE